MCVKSIINYARVLMSRAKLASWRIFQGWRYRALGSRSIVVRPLHVTPGHIRLGDGVLIHAHGRIQGIDCYQGVAFDPEIVFDDGASAQQNLHLTCAERIYVGKNTALAANVTITDINHPYEDIHLPIEQQKIEVSPVEIGKDCKIYNNAVILPGTKIGDHCVVGANSVVSGQFRPFSVIVGSPARVVKQYDHDSGEWRPVSSGREKSHPSGETRT